MRQKNARGLERDIRPVGRTTKRGLSLSGAEIYDLAGDYLGFWAYADMSNDMRRRLAEELRCNWIPANYDPEAL